MATEYTHTREFRGATFRDADLTGATFRECDLSAVRIVASQVSDLRISGFDGEAGTVVVDDVDVTAFVAAELDRRHPERVRLRAVRTADDFRAMWDALESLWSQTIVRAERLPESARHERVDDEWSFAETLRHLVFAADTWAGRMVLGEPEPYHRLGLPPTDFSASDSAELGLDVAAEPSYAEVVALYAASRERVRAVVAALTGDDLEQTRTAALGPGGAPETHSVGDCLRVVMREHCEHRRFAERDLSLLVSGPRARGTGC
ncbi:DinB family protein [Herbidospora mongoliensis]|uniref:DinB family protein n=1 Tax=Herbidospora mongoliensis TaxID=688067 RepID=UPI00082E73AA|nr:DinB family protein [Herbidospora mongoliensis]